MDWVENTELGVSLSLLLRSSEVHNILCQEKRSLLRNGGSTFSLQPKVDHRMALIYDSEASITSESEESDDAFENDETIVQMKKKKVKPLDHLDPKSFPWKLMNYAVSTLVCRNLTMFLADVGLEVSGKSIIY